MQTRIYVENLGQVRAHLRRIEPSLLPEMTREMKAAADAAVVPAARSRINSRSGQAAGSLRATSRGNKGIFIVGGGARAPYYPWLDFGGTLRPVGARRNTQVRPFIRRGRYIRPAVDASMPQFVRRVQIAIHRIVARLNNR
jgi:hypothetical protein